MRAFAPGVGEVWLWATSRFLQSGAWSLCDGSLQPISENDAFYYLIGTTYGGDGQETFAMPDLKGRAIADVGQGSGLDPAKIGRPSP